MWRVNQNTECGNKPIRLTVTPRCRPYGLRGGDGPHKNSSLPLLVRMPKLLAAGETAHIKYQTRDVRTIIAVLRSHGSLWVPPVSLGGR